MNMNATHTISYCYDAAAKQAHDRSTRTFVSKVKKLLPEFTVDSYFSAGGVAVWGERIVHIAKDAQPVVEAWVAKDYLLIRQWDGRNSGRNIYLSRDPADFVAQVHTLAAQPFRRF